MHAHLAAQLADLPAQPGCYIFRDESGRILYIGKAANLRQRVRSYFREDDARAARTRLLAREAASVEVVRTHSAQEALNLENTLIKQHQPFYNIRLRDDATYPWLKLTLNEEFPRLLVVRRRVRDGARYFGPYPDAGAMRATLHLIGRLFPLRKKARPPFKDRPCLNYDIGRCLAPCQGRVEVRTYRDLVEGVQAFLEGRTQELLGRLQVDMAKAAEQLDFEQAARLRDLVEAVRKVTARQVVVGAVDRDMDVVQVATAEGLACVEVLQVRGGKVTGRTEHGLDIPEGLDDKDPATVAQILAAFLVQGTEGRTLPPEILLPVLPEDAEPIRTALEAVRGGRVQLVVPRRGQRVDLLDMAADNARTGLARLILERGASPRADRTAALDRLAGLLGFDGQAHHIEGFDISHTQGTEPVASMVVFEGGLPKKEAYRHFRIREARGGDDFASMGEAVLRRYRRILAEGADLPDVILIDGGPGQLAAAVASLRTLGLEDQPVFGLAKRLEAIFLPDRPEPILLAEDDPARLLVQHVRDEAHRFALGLHRRRRGKAGIRSILEEIPGLGPARRTQLLQRLGSVEAMQAMAPAELARRGGIPRALADRIAERLAGGGRERAREG